MFLGIFGPNGLSMDCFNYPHLQSDLSVHASISKIWPTTGFRIARNRKNPIMLRSSIHSTDRPRGSGAQPPGLPRIPDPIYPAQSTNALHEDGHQAFTKEDWGYRLENDKRPPQWSLSSILHPSQPMHCLVHQPSFALTPAGSTERQTRMRSSLLGNMTPCR